MKKFCLCLDVSKDVEKTKDGSSQQSEVPEILINGKFS